jgi:hypothetical protein
MTNVDELFSVEAVESALDFNKEQGGSMEEYEALLNRRTELERAQARMAPKQNRAAVSSANATAKALTQEIETLEAEVAHLPATEAYSKRARIAQLREQAAQVDARLPFVGLKTDEVTKQAEAAAIRREELVREAKNWEDSPAKKAQITRQMEEAARDSVSAKKELHMRSELERAQTARHAQREREAYERANKQWQEHWDSEIKRISYYYPGGGLVMGDPSERPERWELERAKESRNKPPRESLVEWHRSAIEQEQGG